MKKYLLLTAILLTLGGAILLVPQQMVFAQQPAAPTAPAPTAPPAAAAAATNTTPPDLKDFGTLLTFISRYIRALGYSLAVIAFIYAGFLYFTAYGDESKPTRAKQVFIAVMVGLLLIITSEIIVHATLNTVADQGNVNITPYVNDLTTGNNTKK